MVRNKPGNIFTKELLKYFLIKFSDIPIILETRDKTKYKYEISLIKKGQA